MVTFRNAFCLGVTSGRSDREMIGHECLSFSPNFILQNECMDKCILCSFHAAAREGEDACVNHCLHRAGYSHTGSAGAHSFNGRHRWYFDGCEEPERGCVIVVSNGTTGSHVAFLDSADGTPDTLKMDKSRRVKISRHAVKLFGGNQRGERINSRVTNYNYMLTQVGRNGVRSPYMKPRRGPSNCNLDPVTAFPHHCGKTHRV